MYIIPLFEGNSLGKVREMTFLHMMKRIDWEKKAENRQYDNLKRK